MTDVELFRTAGLRALKSVLRSGKCRWADRDELLSIGYAAIAEAKHLVKSQGRELTEALAVHAARCDMVDYIRREQRIQANRVYRRCFEVRGLRRAIPIRTIRLTGSPC